MLSLIPDPSRGVGEKVAAAPLPIVPPTIVLASIVPISSVGSGHHSFDPFFIGPGPPSHLNNLELEAFHIASPSFGIPSGFANTTFSIGALYNPSFGAHREIKFCSISNNSFELTIPGALLGLSLNILNGTEPTPFRSA